MLRSIPAFVVLALGFASPAMAQAVPHVIATCGVGVSLPLGPGGRLYQDQTGILCTTAGSGGGGGGGATGSVTAAGTSGSVAQAVQGITGGVPQNGFIGQYNATLPTFSNAQVGYVSLDANGRLILAPASSVSVSNFPATQAVADGTDGTGTNPGTGARGWLSGIYARLGGTLTATLATGSNTIGAVTQAGTWAVNATLQAGSAIIGKVGIDQTTPGTTNGVVVNSSALPTGAATSANQSSEIAALGAPADPAYAGSGTSSIIAALKGVYNTLVTANARSIVYADAAKVSYGASSFNFLNSRSPTGVFTKFTVTAGCSQAATLFIRASNDGFASSVYLASSAIAAGSDTPTGTAVVGTTVSVPVNFASYQAAISMGTTAGTCTASSSVTAN